MVISGNSFEVCHSLSRGNNQCKLKFIISNQRKIDNVLHSLKTKLFQEQYKTCLNYRPSISPTGSYGDLSSKHQKASIWIWREEGDQVLMSAAFYDENKYPQLNNFPEIQWASMEMKLLWKWSNLIFKKSQSTNQFHCSIVMQIKALVLQVPKQGRFRTKHAILSVFSCTSPKNPFLDTVREDTDIKRQSVWSRMLMLVQEWHAKARYMQQKAISLAMKW